MANSPQSEKRARQSEARRQQRQSLRARVRTEIKKVRAAPTADGFRKTQSALDSAANKGALHRNTAARHIRRLNRLLHKTTTVAAAAPAADNG